MPVFLDGIAVLDESGRRIGTLTEYGASRLGEELTERGFRVVRSLGAGEEPHEQVDRPRHTDGGQGDESLRRA